MIEIATFILFIAISYLFLGLLALLISVLVFGINRMIKDKEENQDE